MNHWKEEEAVPLIAIGVDMVPKEVKLDRCRVVEGRAQVSGHQKPCGRHRAKIVFLRGKIRRIEVAHFLRLHPT